MVDDKKQPELARRDSLGWLVAVLHSQMAAELDERLKGLELNLGLWPSLFVLWEKEGLTQSELATRCQTAHYTTTRVLDTLEKKGLVERRKHPSSRRAYQIFLTDAGRALEKPAVAEANACNEAFLASLPIEQQRQLRTLLLKVIAPGTGDLLQEKMSASET